MGYESGIHCNYLPKKKEEIQTKQEIRLVILWRKHQSNKYLKLSDQSDTRKNASYGDLLHRKIFPSFDTRRQIRDFYNKPFSPHAFALERTVAVSPLYSAIIRCLAYTTFGSPMLSAI